VIARNDIARLAGADVYDTDGDKVGTVGQVHLDGGSDEPQWVTVMTGLFGLKETFVPLQGASFSGDRVTVAFGKEQIKGAPRIDADGSLSATEEEGLYTYYGLSSHGDSSYSERGEGYNAGGGYQTSTDDRGRDVAHTGHPDDAMTRSEERLVTGTRTEETGRARLRKYVVTEQQQVTVPVSHEEVRLEREPITDANVGDAFDGAEITEAEHEVTLHAERPVVSTETVPVERVRLATETVQDKEIVHGEVRKEQIEFEGPEGRDRG